MNKLLITSILIFNAFHLQVFSHPLHLDFNTKPHTVTQISDHLRNTSGLTVFYTGVYDSHCTMGAKTLKAALWQNAQPVITSVIFRPLSTSSITVNPVLAFLILIFLALAGLLLFSFFRVKLKKMQKKEIRFQQSLIDTLPNPVFFTFEDQLVGGCNQSFEKITGLPREEIIGKPLPDIYLPDQREHHLTINREVALTHRPATYEGKILGYNKSMRDVIFYKSAIYNNKNKKYGVIETIVDITEKKLAIKKAKSTQQRYELVTRATNDGIWDWDLEKSQLFISTRLKEILGYTSAEDHLQPASFEELIHPADHKVFQQQVAHILHEEKKSFAIEVRMMQKDQTCKWCEVNGFILASPSKSVQRLVGSVKDIQQRKDQEDALRLWRDVFHNTLMGVMICKPGQHTIELINPVFAHMHGYTTHELKGQPLSVLWEEENTDTLIKGFKMASQQGHYVFESVHVRKDRSAVPVMIDVTSVKDQNNHLRYHIVNIQDITGRKKQEHKIAQMLHNEQTMNEELRAGEEKLKQTLEQTLVWKERLEQSQKQFFSFMDSTTDFAILKDQNLNYLMVNKSFARHYQKQPDFFKGKSDKEIAPFDLYERERKKDLEVLEKMKMIIYETNDHGQMYETRKFPVFYQKDQVGVGAFVRNITHQKRIEQQVIKNEQKIKTLLENCFDLIMLADDNGKIIYCTDAIKALTGFSEEQVMGKNVTHLIPDADRKKFEEKYARCLQNPKTHININHRIDHCDHTDKHFASVLTNQLDNPLINAVIITSRDVSIEVQTQQLKKNIALAQKSAEIKQQFLANMSHEIRTPMNGIVGMVEFLQKTKLDHQQKDFVQTIKSSADSLLNIINDILDFSVIEAGKMHINPVPVNIRDFLTEIPKVFMASLEQKKLDFQLHIDPAVPAYVVTDPKRLNQVITNLLSNAIKFTARGHIKVKVTTEEVKSNTLMLRVEVKDSGIGISQNEQQNLFKPFSQIDSSFTRNQEGTGLGLSISQRIVELMGGEIGVNSELGKGSLFWFNVKVSIAQKKDLAPENADSAQSEYPRLGLSVLLVEDKRVNQKVIKLMLEYLGCQVSIACNGKEAVDLLAQKRAQWGKGKPAFDIIFMDIQMPVMDGIEATRIIREKFPEYEVIIGLSANVISSDIKSFLQNGLSDFVLKPATTHDLYSKMIAWTRKEDSPGLTDPNLPEAIADIHRLNIVDAHYQHIIRGQSDKDQKVLHELLHSFYNDATENIQNIRAAIQAQNATRKELYVRSLQNQARSMGATQLQAVCEVILTQPLEQKSFWAITDYLESTLESYMNYVKKPL